MKIDTDDELRRKRVRQQFWKQKVREVSIFLAIVIGLVIVGALCLAGGNWINCNIDMYNDIGHCDDWYYASSTAAGIFMSLVLCGILVTAIVFFFITWIRDNWKEAERTVGHKYYGEPEYAPVVLEDGDVPEDDDTKEDEEE